MPIVHALTLGSSHGDGPALAATAAATNETEAANRGGLAALISRADWPVLEPQIVAAPPDVGGRHLFSFPAPSSLE